MEENNKNINEEQILLEHIKIDVENCGDGIVSEEQEKLFKNISEDKKYNEINDIFAELNEIRAILYSPSFRNNTTRLEIKTRIRKVKNKLFGPKFLNGNNERNIYNKTNKQNTEIKNLCNEVEFQYAECVRRYKYSWKNKTITYFTLMNAMMFGLLDISSDIWLMFGYFSDRQYWHGFLTLLFVWGPSFITTYTLYNICQKSSYKSCLFRKLEKIKWIYIIILLFPISSAIVALNNFILFYQNKVNKHNHKVNRKTLLQLQYLDSFLEAAPQLTLQLYVILNNLEQSIQDTSFLNILRWISMVFSLFTIIGVAYSYQDYFSSRKIKVNILFYTLLLFISRLVVISMGLAASPKVTGCCLALHWSITAMVQYIWYRDKQRAVGSNLVESVKYASTSIFMYNNISNLFSFSRRSKRLLYDYSLYTIECIVFTVLWIYLIDIGTFGNVFYYTVSSVGVSLFVFSILLACLYSNYFI